MHVWAKQSFTASGMYSSSAVTEDATEPVFPQPVHAANPVPSGPQVSGYTPPSQSFTSLRLIPPRSTPPQPHRVSTSAASPVGATAQAQGEALLHDARNLIGTLGLYCDLLSMPGVLKPQHRQYADDLRLVGTRSEALIERLIGRLIVASET